MRTRLYGALAMGALSGFVVLGAGTFAFAGDGGFGSLHGGFTHPRMFNRDARFSHPAEQAGNATANASVRSVARVEVLKSGLQPVSQTASKQIASDGPAPEHPNR